MVGIGIQWTGRAILLAFLILGLANCTMLGLNYASLETDNKPAITPALSADFDRASTMTILEDELFGPWPANLPVQSGQLQMIDDHYHGGRGTLQEVMITIGAGEAARTFPVVLALPNQASSAPVPLIISQTFSSNCSVFPGHPVTSPEGTQCDGSRMTGFFGFMATQIFGTYIAEAPVESYLDAGLGYASFQGSGFVPDSAKYGPLVMQRLGPDPKPTSALMAWAFAYKAAADTLSVDPRVRGGAISALGHSRFAKSALIAAAWSSSIDAAIAHQSGFGGAASSRSKTGENLTRMSNSYPHWMRPGLADDLKSGTQLTLDQHYLLALAAPKPIFIGNGRRDVWSDPNSTYRVAQAADVVYEARGVSGLPETNMRDFQPGAEISYWIRTGGHSVVSEDIDAFIAFASAHFLPEPSGETDLLIAQ